MRSPDVLAQYGLRWPDDLQTTTEQELLALRPAQPVPTPWPRGAIDSPPSGIASAQMRDLIGSQLRGRGVEVGALASPFPAPIDCTITYADRLRSKADLVATHPGEPPHDIVEPALQTDLDTLAGVGVESVDFIIASHVIEHSPNPIGAIKTAFRRLRLGGKLVLIVPDKDRTFDRRRGVTALDHLIDDFTNPSHDRDLAHYRDFFTLAFPSSDPDVPIRAWQARQSIHFHVWTYSAFVEVVEWTVANVAPFSRCWSHSTLDDPINDFEFYVTLTK